MFVSNGKITSSLSSCSAYFVFRNCSFTNKHTLSQKKCHKFALLYLAQLMLDSHNIFHLLTKESQKYTVKILYQWKLKRQRYDDLKSSVKIVQFQHVAYNNLTFVSRQNYVIRTRFQFHNVQSTTS